MALLLRIAHAVARPFVNVDAIIAGATANLTVWEGGAGYARLTGVRTSIDHGRLRLLQDDARAPDTLRTRLPLASVGVGVEVQVAAGGGAIRLGVDLTLAPLEVEVEVRGGRGASFWELQWHQAAVADCWLAGLEYLNVTAVGLSASLSALEVWSMEDGGARASAGRAAD